MTEKQLEIHNRKKELLRMLGDIHKEIAFGDLESEGFKEMIRESLRLVMNASLRKKKKQNGFQKYSIPMEV